MYSLGIILKEWNERVLLPLCLESTCLCNPDKIYLCDDGSTDNSIEVAREILKLKGVPAEILQLEQPKQEYFKETMAESEKINILLAKAYTDGCDWVLCIDADEILSIPLSMFLKTTLRETAPYYGVYLPIMDLVQDISHAIATNMNTGFNHYPCPHLKIFGKYSGYRRCVDGMALDQGVEGGEMYIMTPYPYLHLKYLFKTRRHIRNQPIESRKNDFPIINFDYKMFPIPYSYQPECLKQWWKEWKEPVSPW